jgi:hypothetical protein
LKFVETSRRKIEDRLGTERMAQINLARALLGRRKYILFFSHMRSYSTLLGHLIGSHPQVTGYAEQHRSYRSFVDLTELRYGIWKLSDYEVKGDYLFDKILHNKHIISDDVLERRDVLPIYGIREPISGLRSIVAMGRRGKKANWRNEPDTASLHLFNRYAAVRDLCKRRPDAAALFTDSIVTAPEQTLADLSRYLGLDSPIQPEYDRLPKTGVGGFGDPMGPIKAGRIVADRPAHEVEIPDELAIRLIEDYQITCDLLTNKCATVLGEPVQRPMPVASEDVSALPS